MGESKIESTEEIESIEEYNIASRKREKVEILTKEKTHRKSKKSPIDQASISN